MKSSKTYYDYAELRNESIFDLTDEALQERLRPVAEKLRRDTFAKGGYLTYYDPLYCPTTHHAVHDYGDRKELMWMDDNYKEHFLRVLWSADQD